jgi:hypothetical protein
MQHCACVGTAVWSECSKKQVVTIISSVVGSSSLTTHLLLQGTPIEVAVWSM